MNLRLKTHGSSALVLLSLALASCSSAPKASPQSAAAPVAAGDTVGPPEPYGPPAPPSSTTADTPATYGPEPIQYRSIVLVLGPGAARGFAYAGAIRALVDAKIPIASILGSEMGALIGSMYAVDGKVNRFEWALLKLNEDVLTPPKSYLPNLFKSSARLPKLEKELERIFANRDLNQTKIPMKVVTAPDGKIVDRGLLAQVLQQAMDVLPPSFAASEAALIAEARSSNLGPVVVISTGTDVADSGNAGGADLVIHPDIQGLSDADHSKKTEAAFRGKQAIEKNLPAIRHLVGLPL